MVSSAVERGSLQAGQPSDLGAHLLMTSVLIVSHSSRAVDNTLWLRILDHYPETSLAVPETSSAGLGEAKGLRDRIHAVPPLRFGSETASWHRGLMTLLDRLGPDLVHVDGEPWSLIVQALVRRGQPTIAHSAENVILDAPVPYRIRRTGLKRTLRGLAGLATWGSTALLALENAGLPASTPRAVLPARPPSPDIFAPRAPREPDSVLRVGFVGRLVPEKGIDTAIKAVAGCRAPVQLDVFGSGSHDAALRALAASGGTPVIFHPPGGPRRVAEFMSQRDVIVVPSRAHRTWREQWCRVAVEAMMLGRPVVASDSGELPETVGIPQWIFPEGDERALAMILEDLAAQHDLGHAREMALRSAARFNIDVMSKVLIDLWDRASRGGGLR
jgi:glycosyltransferase involved in cell wall biosynthesis